MPPNSSSQPQNSLQAGESPIERNSSASFCSSTAARALTASSGFSPSFLMRQSATRSSSTASGHVRGRGGQGVVLDLAAAAPGMAIELPAGGIERRAHGDKNIVMHLEFAGVAADGD